MNALKHWLITVAAIVVATVPAILADPAGRSMVANHPWLAAYLPILSAVVVAAYHAIVTTGPAATTGTPPASPPPAADASKP